MLTASAFELLQPKNGPSLPRIVSTSWDDGDTSDLKIAELLQSRGLTGTFYVPLTNGETEVLCSGDLRALCASGFEIGAHSVSHKTLRHLRTEELTCEVTTCKHKLQDCLGREVAMFCYPNGYYDPKVVEAVKQAGYAGARTCRMLSIDSNMSTFEMPTSIQAFPHSSSRYLRNLGRAHNLPAIWRYVTQLSRYGNWVELGKHLFDTMLEYGGVWHLYGHSWEVENLKLWPELEQMFDYVAHREGVTYATNGALLRVSNGCGASARPKIHTDAHSPMQ
jgi:peptidoglycan/xylan/chitin deacetylase (PgdA/CDA1 family)